MKLFGKKSRDFEDELEGIDNIDETVNEDNSEESELKPLDYVFKPYSIRNSNIRILIAVFLVLYIVLFTISFSNQMNQFNYTRTQTEDYLLKTKQANYDLKSDLRNSNERYTSRMLKLILSTSDIAFFTTKLWDYKLYAGDTAIRDTKSIRINKNDSIMIQVTRRSSSLPKEFINIGSLTGGDPYDSPANYITLGETSYSLKTSTTGNIESYVFEMPMLKSGNKFTLGITDQLAERLGFTNKKISVIIN